MSDGPGTSTTAGPTYLPGDHMLRTSISAPNGRIVISACRLQTLPLNSGWGTARRELEVYGCCVQPHLSETNEVMCDDRPPEEIVMHSYPLFGPLKHVPVTTTRFFGDPTLYDVFPEEHTLLETCHSFGRLIYVVDFEYRDDVVLVIDDGTESVPISTIRVVNIRDLSHEFRYTPEGMTRRLCEKIASLRCSA